VIVFVMFLAREAYFSVLRVSSHTMAAGLTQAIMYVLVLPPRESLSNLVSFESR
jgi:hypothetical protein